jgi:hypothetical protein
VNKYFIHSLNFVTKEQSSAFGNGVIGVDEIFDASKIIINKKPALLLLTSCAVFLKKKVLECIE